MRGGLRYFVVCFVMGLTGLAMAQLTSWSDMRSSDIDFTRQTQNAAMLMKGSDSELYYLEVDETTGAIPVSGTFSFTDADWGAVGASTQRVAAVIGNESDVADFGSGAASAQTLRVTVATDDTVTVDSTDLDIRDLTSASDSVAAAQTGAWTVDLDASASVDVENLPTTVDTNFGSPGASTVRVAAELGVGGAAVANGNPVPVSDAGGTLSVDATDLDIRDLTDASDAVQIGDGVDQVDVTAAGELEVSLTTAVPAGTNNIGDVDIASAIPAGTNNIGSVETAGKSSVELIRHDHSSTAVTTSAYTQLVASTSGTINRLHIFDSSGEALILATGAAASENDIAYIPPGGLDAPLDINIASGTRLSVKALTGNTSAGDLIITALD